MHRSTKIELVLPRWIGTMSGILLIGILALGGAVYTQAQLLDEQTKIVAVLAEQVETLADRTEDLSKDREQLRELQEWRIGVTIASRAGWAAANRYILNNPLPMPDGMTEETRPAPYEGNPFK